MAIRRLRTRLLVVILLAVAPAIGAIVYSGYSGQRAAYVRARREANALATTVSASYRQTTGQTQNLVAVLAQVPAVRSGSSTQCDTFLARILHDNPALANIGVIDDRGFLACSAAPLSGPVYLGDRPYYRQVRKGGAPVVGSFQIGRVVHTPMVVFAAPLAAVTGSHHSVVYASLRLSWLHQLAEDTALPAGSSLTVLDDTGRVIVRYPHSSSWLGKKVQTLDRLAHGLGARRSEIVTAAGANGVRQLFAVYSQGGARSGTDPYVLVGIPTSEILAPARQALLVNLLTLGIVVALLLVIGWWASQRLILGRVGALVSVADRLGSGDHTARTRLRGQDELAALGRSFDRMADALEEQTLDMHAQLARIERLNRTYRVLSAINGAILRIRDRDVLLEEACRIAVDLGGHPLAWIGMIDPEERRVRLAAHAGIGREMVERLYVSTDPQVAEGKGTVGPAVRSGKARACNDVLEDPRMAPWRQELLEHGCLSLATFPLRLREEVIGNFTIYSATREYFDEQEMRLFEEVAADTSLGLELIDTGDQRDYLVHHDAATGLPNRKWFVEALAQALNVGAPRGDSPAVLAVEIPELPKIADRFGRHFADEMMRTLVPELQGVLMQPYLLAAIGPYTYGIALFGGSAEARNPRAAADRILKLFPHDMEHHGEHHLLTARVGAAPSGGEVDADALTRNAEVALHALEAAPDRHFQFYSAQEDASAQRQHRVGQALRRAIRNGEFDVVYQPYIDIGSGRVAGAEALLRWHSEELGVIPPGEFIPVAEEAGLVGDIGAWVFQAVLRQLKDWCGRGISPGTISVNISPQEVQEPDVVAAVEGHVVRSGVDPSRCPVALELTETAVVQDFGRVSEALEQIKALGLHTYLDDYGTGYSSLLYLQQIPLDGLKIDLSFIRRITEDPASLALTRSSIALGHSLGLKVIAEGVETEAQLALLRKLGCDIAQGYLFSKPLAPGDLERFLEERGPPAV